MNSVRPYKSDDESAVVRVWHRSGRDAYSYLPAWQTLTLEKAHQVFREVILTNCQMWVGTQDNRIVAYLAMKNTYIDRLYVDPSQQNRGWGGRFIDFAKSVHPKGLELHTHQENHGACRLYERHGFVAVKFGLSPPPESAPDVEYHWRPDVSF